MMIRRMVLTAAALTTALVVCVGAVTAQEPRLPALDLLPTADELPAGFVHQRDRDVDLTRPGVSGFTRWYQRPNPDVVPDDVTLLQISIVVAQSADFADAVFDATLGSWMREGFTIERLSGVIGERAVIVASAKAASAATHGLAGLPSELPGRLHTAAATGPELHEHPLSSVPGAATGPAPV